MKRPSDDHWNRLTPAQQRKTRIILETLKSRRVRYVLGGGWAVYAHDSTTPSVDCDVYLKRNLPNPILRELSDLGIRVGPQLDLEILELESPTELLGTGEPDLGIAATSYLPAGIFKGRLEQKTLRLDQVVADVPVPSRAALAVTKFGALQGRSLAYRSFVDAEARMRLGPAVVPQILSLGQSYYLRKAGKDLFDLSVLLPSVRHVQAARRIAGPEMWSVARAEVAVLSSAVKELGKDMAKRVGKATPETLLRTLQATS